MTWDEAKLFLKFFVGGITVLATVAGLWLTLDLPQVASKEYVNSKFALAADYTKALQNNLNSTRLQINRMTRQSLESEKYNLEQKLKTGADFETQRRLNDVNSSLVDVQKERDRIQAEQVAH